MAWQPKQEVRFAVVLYGGVSLAIYMNGIAQEFLRLVRSSADLDPGEKLTGTELVYRRLAATLQRRMPDQMAAVDDPIQTRFVIDIISGTSAGGINGVALAKALAVGSRNLEDLNQVWINEANIGTLLNDGASVANLTRPKTALLNGERMYGLLRGTLDAMNDPAKHAALNRPYCDMLDLFVTATDLAGVPGPIQLTGSTIEERIHKSVFHFEYDARSQRDDFTRDYDAMLAFAARCTSSFPVAFEPMRFDKMRDYISDFRKPGAFEKVRETYSKFFPGLKVRGKPFEARQFADGGYLDNRPFSHAINLIPSRSSGLPGQRKLIFVDPFPDTKAQTEDTDDIDFVRNSLLAAKTLPRYEVIRDDIRSVVSINRRLDRLDALQKRWQLDRDKLDLHNQPTKPVNFEETDLKDLALTPGYGAFYPLYHHLRVYGTSDALAAMVTGAAGYEMNSDEFSYLRLLMRAWRDSNFTAYRDGRRQTESAFLASYDADFRMRRLVHLRSRIDVTLTYNPDPAAVPVLAELRDRVEDQLAIIRRELRRLASPTDHALLEPERVAQLREGLEAAYASVMLLTSRDERSSQAEKVYMTDAIRPRIDAAMLAVAKALKEVFDASSKEINAVFDAHAAMPTIARMKDVYDRFHWHDVATFPFLEGSEVQEHSEIQTFRISPADSGLVADPAKLAGIALGAFGGFLNREWREHDILWGRLDGAERIITSLLPAPGEKALRDQFIEAARDAILEEELGGEVGSRRQMIWLAKKLRDRNVTDRSAEELVSRGKDLLQVFPAIGQLDDNEKRRQFFTGHYEKPPGPLPRDVADWSSRSARILARMIDDLPTSTPGAALRGRLSRGLRSGGVLAAQVAQFSMPGSFQRLQARYVLFLALIVGLLVTLFATLLGVGTVAQIGVAMIVGVLGAWLVLNSVGRVLRGRAAWTTPVKGLALVVVIGLAVFGAMRLWEEFGTWAGGPAPQPVVETSD